MKKKQIYKIILVFFFIIIGIFFIYTSNYLKANTTDINKIYSSNPNIDEIDNFTVIYPNKSNDKNIGLIFYPGGKVEDKAYLPLLNQISQTGVTCFLVKMPFNLAVFNIDAADKIIERYPSINNWFLSGHSLGGAMASSYAADNYKKLEGLILLASYPLNEAPISTICIFGSLDTVLDVSKLDGATKIEIEGANHANFGNYGSQKGDTVATISREKQQQITVEAIRNFIFK